MTNPPIIFIGGYTKSGTTFLGRTLEAFEGVYSRGEMDYLRMFAGNMAKIFSSYNHNINIVNEEVYDGQGKLKPISPARQRVLQCTIFYDLFFNGQGIPDDCRVVVEKSPRNLFNYPAIRMISPLATYINIYRPTIPVYKSLIRHMADHRTQEYHDPESAPRQKTLENFVLRWNRHVQILEHLGSSVTQLHYDRIVHDVAGFLAWAGEHIFKGQLPCVKGPADLTKEAYLKSLPRERRAKSLVQTSTKKIHLSDQEIARLTGDCATPKIDFDF